MLGAGLWNDPRIAALVELLLVVAGAVLYWRAARQVSLKAGRSGGLASLSAAMVMAFGLVVLWMDYTS